VLQSIDLKRQRFTLTDQFSMKASISFCCRAAPWQHFHPPKKFPYREMKRFSHGTFC
jgi:hypothetical protein